MYVRVSAHDGDLHFEDAGYFLQVMGLRVPVPRLLGPGRVLLRHEDIGSNAFAITIDIVHPWFGRMYFQQGRFVHEASSSA